LNCFQLLPAELQLSVKCICVRFYQIFIFCATCCQRCFALLQASSLEFCFDGRRALVANFLAIFQLSHFCFQIDLSTLECLFDSLTGRDTFFVLLGFGIQKGDGLLVAELLGLELLNLGFCLFEFSKHAQHAVWKIPSQNLHLIFENTHFFIARVQLLVFF
jgi:hypothetical protein